MSGVILFIFLAAAFVVFRFTINKNKTVDVKQYYELLRFFPPDQKLTVPELSEIIKQRTSGKRDLSDAYLYKACNALVKDGKLLMEETFPFSNRDEITGKDDTDLRKVKIILYFLPK